MSALNLTPGLEEFQEEIEGSLAADAPDVGELVSSDQEVQDQSSAIDEDLSSLQNSAQALENIISLVEETPTPDEQPLDEGMRGAVGLALEANDIVAATGNQVALTGDKGQTKKDFLDKAKDFAKKVWAMLAGMGKKILEWIRQAWAGATDRLVKNTKKAAQLAAALKNINSRPDAKIEDERILNAVANATGDDVGNIVLAVFDHAKLQSEKAAKQVTHEAVLLVEAISSGRSNNEALLDKFTTLLGQGGGSYRAEASAEQAQALKAPAGAKVLLSDPFFGGNRAWLVAPENAEALKLWNHGIGQADKTKPVGDAAPDVSELEAICEYISKGQDLVRIYQTDIKALDELQKKVEAAGKKPGEGVDKGQLSQIQAVIPRIIKGPQVAAYNYAGTASSIALAYVSAAVKAHQKDPNAKSIGDKASDAAASVKSKFTKKD